MELSPKQQAVNLISESINILIATHQQPDSDGIGSALGFALALKKLGKNPQIVCAEDVPDNLHFLPQSNLIVKEIEAQSEFIINLNCQNAEVEKLGYKLENDILKIIITLKKGELKKEDVATDASGKKVDLLIILDTPDWDRLGGLREKYSEVFYSVPVINIDHHSTNNYFGKVNLVDLTATSTSEILISLIEALEKDQKLIDEDIATCLLAGIIGDTGSFQNSNTTPKSLTCAAQLLAAGARQQEIVRHLFKTKPLSTLKLWGRILNKIEYDNTYRFVYSVATKEDLIQAGAKEEDFAGVIDELLRSAKSADLALLLSEREQGICGSLRAIDPTVDCLPIAQSFGGGGHKGAAAFVVNGKSIEEVKQEVINKVKEYQRARLGLD